MSKTVTLASPYAPPPVQSGTTTAPRAKNSKSIRLGVLDNSKGNADHLLGMIVDAVRAAAPIASVVSLRKGNVALGAPKPILEQLAQEADFVITAMAD
jgi:hypothetical protein